MERKEARKIAMKLMLEQLENTSYSLERDEYEKLPIEDVEMITMEMSKVTDQFKKRYSL